MRNTVLYTQAKLHPGLPLFLLNFGECKKTLISQNVERIIFVYLTAVEMFALIVDLSLT